MKPRTAGLLLAAAWLTVSCDKRPEATSAVGRPGGPPRGDAVWFADPAGAVEAGMEERLTRLSAAAVFVPAGALGLQGGRSAFQPVTPPPRPIAGSPVVLVVRCDPAVGAALATEAGLDPDATATVLAEGLRPFATPSGAFGRAAGVHLDFPFSAASAKKSGALVAALKTKLPGVWISIAAPFSPVTEDGRDALLPLTNAADALVVPIFGFDVHGDAGSVDLLGRPWWAAFGAATQGAIIPAGGSDRTSGASERWLDPLTGNPQVDFENDLSVPDASFMAFHLTARGPVRLEGLTLENGDRVTYRMPVLTELLFQLGSTMAGKKNALGRLLVFDGAEEASRIFPVVALEDVILGRSLAPALIVTVSPAGRGAIAIEAVNRSPHASIASRTSNWVEVDLTPAHPGDVALGGFDRYAAYDAAGRSVTLGRATRVRLFETLVGPNETISPARIVLRGKPPAPCCRWRSELIAASGSEEKSAWTEPPAPPTPTPAPRKKKRSRRRRTGGGAREACSPGRSRRRRGRGPRERPADDTPRSRRRGRWRAGSRPAAFAAGRGP